MRVLVQSDPFDAAALLSGFGAVATIMIGAPTSIRPKRWTTSTSVSAKRRAAARAWSDSAASVMPG